MTKMIWKKQWVIALVAAIYVGVGWGPGGALLAQESTEKKPLKLEVDKSPLPRGEKMVHSYADVVDKVAPCVVNIFSTKTVRSPYQDWLPFFDDPFFRRFFGDRFSRRGPRTFKQQNLGSGVIVTEDGYIVTNDHVVNGADEIKVAIDKSKKEYTAKVVGSDPRTDIAVLKIEEDGLPHITLGDSDQIRVGDVVLAIGNPFGVGKTVTMGIVSAVGRGGMGIEEYEDFIQTDAAINPGNSGGALVDTKGRLIGINTAIVSRSGGNQGIGFAIPVNLVRNVMDKLIKTGKVEHGFLGVSIQDLTPELAKQFGAPEDSQGALVSEVVKDSAAEKAGIKPGDVIVEVNGEKIEDSRDLKLTIGQYSPGDEVKIKVLRDGKPRTFEVRLKAMPGSEVAAGEQDNEVLKGVTVADLTPDYRRQLDIPDDVEGALIVEIDPNSAAYQAGLREGDVILEIGRRRVRNADEAVRFSHGLKERKVLVRVWSQGRTRYVLVDESRER